MATLTFAAPAVLELLRHAIAAPKHSSPYSQEDPGPGLFLVKDEGVYLMSNGKPGLPGENAANKVVYAKGYEPLTEARRDGTDTWGERYEKIRDAVGGDDFGEFLPADSFKGLQPQDKLTIRISATAIDLTIIPGPTPKPTTA
jgi:hypothetical protein